MVNNQKICGLIGLATKAGKIVAGTDECLQEIDKRKVKLIILAIDASDVFKEKCKQLNINIYEKLTINEISNSIGKSNKAVLGIKDNGFAKAMNKIINGGEMIG